MENEDIASVLREVFELSNEQVQSRLERYNIIRAEHGFATLSNDMIVELYVRPEWRVQDMGRQLIQQAIEQGGMRL